jgi:hypothetical protein
MKAAWYQKQGVARDVLIVGEMNKPQTLAGEVRIRVGFSGVNPGDVKKRQDAFGVGMPYPRVIPHSDGAGTIDDEIVNTTPVPDCTAPSVAIDRHLDGNFNPAPDLSCVEGQSERRSPAVTRLISI